MAARRSFSPAMLTRLREMPSGDVLPLVAIDVKADPTYLPIKAGRSRRWHVLSIRGEFEILTTGPKWYDMRARRGGGGAIDLAMHVLGVSFVDAVRHLTAAAGQNGPDRS
jgi:hypothetical protein